MVPKPALTMAHAETPMGHQNHAEVHGHAKAPMGHQGHAEAPVEHWDHAEVSVGHLGFPML